MIFDFLSRAFIASLILCLGACSDDSGLPGSAADAIVTYADIVSATYEDSIEGAILLDEAMNALVDAPSNASLAAAKEAWLASREPYLQTEVYRFYDGPIDNPSDGPEGQLNAWPMDEAHVDYVEGDPDAGLINDPSFDITAENLLASNEQGGEENVAVGYHPIEFLLWGQDFSVTGPGERPFEDYAVDGSVPNADRRGEYLRLLGDQLLADLMQVRDAWAAGSDGNYRAGMLEAGDTEGLRRILTGMIVLSGFETAGERLQTALDSGDQEDEHSCFSDNTHRDMVQNVRGVQNVYLGTYVRTDGTVVSGTGIFDVVRAMDAELADTVKERLALSLAAAEALQPPFDQEIGPNNSAGRARVQALIDGLRSVEDGLFEVFTLFGLSVEIPE